MTTRRQFFGTLGKALGAGGLILPFAGKGALALPADLGKAASLPVTPTAMPRSPEFAAFQETWRELHSVYLWPEDYPSQGARQQAWRDIMVNRCQPLKAQIIGRANPTWTDCVEIAHICLHRIYRQGPHDRGDPLYALPHAVLSAGGVDGVFIPEIGQHSLGEGGTL